MRQPLLAEFHHESLFELNFYLVFPMFRIFTYFRSTHPHAFIAKRFLLSFMPVITVSFIYACSHFLLYEAILILDLISEYSGEVLFFSGQHKSIGWN